MKQAQMHINERFPAKSPSEKINYDFLVFNC